MAKAPEPKMMQASVSRAAPSQVNQSKMSMASVAPSNISRPPVKSNMIANLDDLEDLE